MADVHLAGTAPSGRHRTGDLRRRPVVDGFSKDDQYAVTIPTRSPMGHPGLLVTLVEGSDYPYVYFFAVAARA